MKKKLKRAPVMRAAKFIEKDSPKDGLRRSSILGGIILAFIIAALMLGPCKKAHADTSQVAIAAAMGWLAPAAFDLILPPAPKEHPHARHLMIVGMSLMTEAAYEGIRSGGQRNFDMANTYASSLGTMARISWSW